MIEKAQIENSEKPVFDTQAQFIKVNGLRLRYLDQGEGPTILLLHGFPDDLTVWDKLTPFLLRAGYRVLAFDQRGFGESEMAATCGDYHIDKIVSDIPMLLDQLALTEPVYLVGHDWGAVIAWAFCLAHPERVRASVNISVGHPESYRRAGLFQKLIKGFYTLWFQCRGLAEWYLRRGGLKRWLSSHPEPNPSINSMSRPERLTAGLSWYRANFASILFQPWPDCYVPTLSIWSAQDRFLSEAQVINSRKYMQAEWQYKRIENTGHWVPLEQAEQLADLLLDWFADK